MKRKGKLREATTNLIFELDEAIEEKNDEIKAKEKERDSLINEKALLYNKLKD